MVQATGVSASIKAITTLCSRINSRSAKQDSLYEEAAGYFSRQEAGDGAAAGLRQNLETARRNLGNNTKAASHARLDARVASCQRLLDDHQLAEDELRLARLAKLKKLCGDILDLCEGRDRDEANTKVAKLLGTLLLGAPSEIKAVLPYNQRSKHLYQAVLSLKLLEQMAADGLITNPYILERLPQGDPEREAAYRDEVQIPLLMTALLQDVGMYHPTARQILKGEQGDLNEFRVLENEERIAFLKIMYHQTYRYLVYGIGQDRFVGNTRQEQAAFEQRERDKLAFIQSLLKSSLQPGQGVGNLLKVPQIYTSVVMSTKPNFTYLSLPKAFMLLNKGAERGGHSQAVVDCLLKITGIFPQGFGVTYIPKDSERYDQDRYEYAIVNTLYPKEPHRPTCRTVTRNLVFASHGVNNSISPENNLYYSSTRKKLEKISAARLEEIMEKLWNNHQQRKDELALVPAYWHTYDYFSNTRNQNLWTREITLSN